MNTTSKASTSQKKTEEVLTSPHSNQLTSVIDKKPTSSSKESRDKTQNRDLLNFGTTQPPLRKILKIPHATSFRNRNI